MKWQQRKIIQRLYLTFKISLFKWSWIEEDIDIAYNYYLQASKLGSDMAEII